MSEQRPAAMRMVHTTAERPLVLGGVASMRMSRIDTTSACACEQQTETSAGSSTRDERVASAEAGAP
jgi:DNA-binding ferritin-like protein